MECMDACGCGPKPCKNRAVTEGRHKVLGELEVFGMDQNTRICIEKALPAQTRELWPHPDKPKSHLISALLLPAINRTASSWPSTRASAASTTRWGW